MRGLKAVLAAALLAFVAGSAGAQSVTYSGFLPMSGGTLTGALSITPQGQVVTSDLATGFHTAAGISGTTTGNPAYRYSVFDFNITSDALGVSNTNQFIEGLKLQHSFGGAGFTGNRDTLQVNLLQTATTGNTIASGHSGFYVPFQTLGRMSANDNGTGLTTSTAHGRVYGGALMGQALSGATNLYQVTGLELNAEVDSGATSMIRNFLSVASTGGSVQGSLVDAGIWLYSTSGALMKTGILFGGGNVTKYPLDPTGTLIAADATGSVTAAADKGIDFSSVAFTTASLKMPNFTVDGGGNATLGGAVSKADWTTAGVALSIPSATFTDTTSSGTVSGSHAVVGIAQPTVAASSSTTYSGNYATLRIGGPPLAGANVTLSAAKALHVASGTSQFDGNVNVNGTVNVNASNNAAVNIGTGTTTSAVTLGGGSNAVVINSTTSGSVTTGAISGTTLAATGHTTFEGVTSTGATGTGKLVYDTSPTTSNETLGGTTVNITATNLQRNGNAVGMTRTFTATYDPASLNAATQRADAVTVTGITTTGGAVVANPGTTPATGCIIAAVRATNTNEVTLIWQNSNTVAACDTASSTWTFSQAQ